MRRKRATWACGLCACVMTALACGSQDEAGSLSFPGDAGADAKNSPTSDAGVGALFPANGIVIVHAASLPAFRLCFEADKSLRPLPSEQLMPDSNIVGVEVGSAVRIDPLPAAMGRVWAFEEPAIRVYYPPGKQGPPCNDLLRDIPEQAHDLGKIERDLATGVHLLILTGCRRSVLDPAASVERCGETWASDAGNLTLDVLPLGAYGRPDTQNLPIQIVQLSRGLAARAAGRSISVSFGALTASPPPFLSDELAFGEVVPQTPKTIAYDPDDTAGYATTGFHVALGPRAASDGGDAGPVEAGASELLFRQSLADVGRLSSTREVPPEWFATASSYVLLLLGEPSPTDAGADGGLDERRSLHLLAVPVAVPDEPDGGDAGSGDGSAAN